jgi:hypothetical protein
MADDFPTHGGFPLPYRPASQEAVDRILFKLDRVIGQLSDVLRRLGATQQEVSALMSAIDDLEAKVAAQETVEQSAIALLTGIGQELKDALANNDQARIEALSAKIDGDTQNLAAAVSANTPAAPAADAGGTGTQAAAS